MRPQLLRTSPPASVYLVWLSFLFLLAATRCVAQSPTTAQGNAAPVFSLGYDSLKVASLDGLWRFQSGDDPRWAQPGFDDSSWAPVRSDKDWRDQGMPVASGTFWYRARLIVPAGTGPLSIYIPAIHLNYQVFADGKVLGGVGTMPPDARPIATVAAVYPLSQQATPQARTITLAIRAWRYPPWSVVYWSGLEPGILAGDSKLMQQTALLNIRELSWNSVSTLFLVLLDILAGIAALALFNVRNQEREYLWFGVAMLLSAIDSGLGTYRVFRPTDVLHLNLVQALLGYAIDFAFIGFYRRLMDSRRDWLYWTCIVSVCTAMVLNIFIFTPGALSTPQLLFFWFPTILLFSVPFYIWILVLLVRRAMEGRVDALLLVLSNIPGLLGLCYGFARFVGEPAFGWKANTMDWYSQTTQWPFPTSIPDLGSFLLMLTMLAILIHRFTRTSLQEEDHKRELEAARVVQQVLIPHAIPSIPGFKVKAVYKPAGQVGGDFFQILSPRNGGILIAIGDVSGKGMPAAMMVGLLVGTLRTLAEYTRSPGEILAAMNQRMLAQSSGGFTTCLILRADLDGTATVANAGHLSPYLRGQELVVESNFPLGVAAGIVYKESTFHLAVNDQLTLVTDGVVEARDKNGGLFGFERTANISTQAAETVAQMAANFGQDDDITVVTLAREEAAVGSAAPMMATTESSSLA